MIKHIVMWKLKEDGQESRADNAAKMKTMLEALVGEIPEIKHLEVATDVFVSAPDTDVALYSEFASRADLETYAAHPEHQKCVAFIKEIVAERRVVDYEI